MKKIKRTIVITLSFIILILIFFFSFRNIILHSILERKISEFEKKYPAKIIINDSYFTGFKSIELSGIKIIPEKRETLFVATSVNINLKLLPIISGKIKVKDLEIEGIRMNIVKKNAIDNYSFLFSKKLKKSNNIEQNYASFLNGIFNFIFDIIPQNITINNLVIKTTLDSNDILMAVKELKIKNHRFKTSINIVEKDNKYVWISEGNINKINKTAGIKIYTNSKKASIPILNNRWGLLFSFDTLQMELKENLLKNDMLEISGNIYVFRLLLNHKKISSNDVKMDKVLFDYHFKIGKNFIELDSNSSVAYNKLSLNPYILFQKDDSKKYTFKINNKFLAQDFFGSLPTGLFSNFDGIKTEGDLKLHFDFFVDMKFPDSLRFNMNLAGDKFKVLTYGITDFTKLREPFTFTAYENGNKVKSFIVGDENPEFVPLDEISTCLKEAILVSENGGYYFANGFDINSLRLSIIENIKQKRFARGGSTIEMQLVKNVFLNKNKTIARKIEELLIVWLFQSENLCDKDRMYEVYLNVLEWGPEIYGVYEAAKYYFDKHPSKLSLAESIFLSSILPRPKWYKYSFNEKGELKYELNNTYFSTIANLLLEKAIIATDDTNKLLSKVKLKGESKLYLAKDTTHFKMDSLMMWDD